jgi:hypothetical protein
MPTTDVATITRYSIVTREQLTSVEVASFSKLTFAKNVIRNPDRVLDGKAAAHTSTITLESGRDVNGLGSWYDLVQTGRLKAAKKDFKLLGYAADGSLALEYSAGSGWPVAVKESTATDPVTGKAYTAVQKAVFRCTSLSRTA